MYHVSLLSVGDGRPTPKSAIIAPIVLVLAIGAFFYMRSKRKSDNQATA